jgi:hypothetical protein
MAPGDYLPVACADDVFSPNAAGLLVDTVFEAIEFNCTAGTTSLRVTAPELGMTGITSPQLTDPVTRIELGGIIEITDTVSNGGDADAGTFVIRYLLSSDETMDRADLLLTGMREVAVPMTGGPALPVGGSSTGMVSVTVPSDTAPGEYFLGACADWENRVYEGKEHDNCIVGGKVAVVAPVLEIVSGDRQEAPVNEPYPDPLVVRVTDGAGQPLADKELLWLILSADGARFVQSDGTLVTGFTGFSDAAGEARATVRMGTTPETHQYLVTCVECVVGQNQVTFNGMAVDATITLSASSVLPRPLGAKIDENQSTATVEVTPKLRMNGDPWEVTMQVIEGTGGGHDEGHTGTRPTGGITIEGEAVPGAKTCLGLLQPTAASTSVTTDGAGKAEFIYTSCEVSGVETLQASVTLASGAPLPKTTTITVEVKDGVQPLTQIEGGDDFGLSGGTIQHQTGINHYGTKTSRDRMRVIANRYAAHLKISGRKLGINDMSLEKGGLFDLSGHWDIVKGHKSHRDGKDADIDRAHFGEDSCRSSTENVPGPTCVKQKVLRETIFKVTQGTSSLLLEPEEPPCAPDVANRPVPNEPGQWQICKMHIDLEKP